MFLSFGQRIVEPSSAADQQHRTVFRRNDTIDTTSLVAPATESQPSAGSRRPTTGVFRVLLSGVFALTCLVRIAWGQEECTARQRYPAAEARQAVAVDEQHFYAITNERIGKYLLETGEPVQQWAATPERPLRHLNSGIVRDGRLYCAHSNYPHVPESSSVEIWDTSTLQHIGSHSFGIYEGSLTWIDWKDDAWWAVFAHYSHAVGKDSRTRDSRWTSLVKFDSNWRRLAGWVFPDEVLERFEPYSCSGGAWGPDGSLYCTGHDRAEVYRLQLPRAGSTLLLTHTLPAPIAGQGIAWSPDGRLLGIHRKQRVVVICDPPKLLAD